MSMNSQYYQCSGQPAGTLNRDFLRQEFFKVDKDRSGAISAKELQAALRNGAGTDFNMETVELMIGMFDCQNRGVINFPDYCSLRKYIKDWQDCFRRFDRNNSGDINCSELREALTAFGYRLQDETYNTLLRRYNRMERGTIFFDDFIHCCIKLNNLTSRFKYHADMNGIITINYNQFLQMVMSL